jgi:hypothetical protein
VGELDLLVVAALVVAAIVATVQNTTNGHSPGWWLILMRLGILWTLSAGGLPTAVCRALPAP